MISSIEENDKFENISIFKRVACDDFELYYLFKRVIKLHDIVK